MIRVMGWRVAGATGLLASMFVCVLAADAIGAANDKCCDPASAINPSPPSGGKDDCKIPSGGTKCVKSGNRCSGDAYQAAKDGKCNPSPGLYCESAGITQPVILQKGVWNCLPDTTGSCCVWVPYDPPQTTTESKPSCVGDGCSSEPPM
jgi:hypothetical protein